MFRMKYVRTSGNPPTCLGDGELRGEVKGLGLGVRAWVLEFGVWGIYFKVLGSRLRV